MAKFLFVTDLDYTLVGDDLALERLNQWLSEQRRIYGTVICYTTGRSQPLYQQLISEKELLAPDILILAVGTEIYYQGSSTPNQDWSNKISQSWHQEQVFKIAKKIPDLALLSAVEQTPFKASYYINSDEPHRVISYLKATLDSQGLAVKIVDWAAGKYIDILPQDTDKGSSLAFVQQRLGFTDEQTVICGDSGNDLAMFQTVPSYGIIVGNAQPEVLQWHKNYPPGKRYLAQNHFAAGILEGLEYFGFLRGHQRITYSNPQRQNSKIA